MKLFDKYFKKPVIEEIRVVDEISKVKLNFTKLDYSIEDKLEENEKKALLAEASLLNQNQTLKKILDNFIQVNGDYIARRARTLEELFWGRANINSIELIKEELNRLDNLYKDSTLAEEIYNKADII